MDLTSRLDARSNCTDSLLLESKDNSCGVSSDLTGSQPGEMTVHLPEAWSVTIGAELSSEGVAWLPVALGFSPLDGVFFVVSERSEARKVWQVSAVHVLLSVRDSDNLSSVRKVDNLELVVLKVGNSGIVAENERDRVLSLAVPGSLGCDISGDLITDTSVRATTVLHPAGDGGDSEKVSATVIDFQCCDSRDCFAVFEAIVGGVGVWSRLFAVCSEITRVDWESVLCVKLDVSTRSVRPVNII